MAFSLVLLTTGNLSAAPVRLNGGLNELKVRDITPQGFTMSLSFSEFQTIDVKTEAGIFTRLVVPGYSRSGEYGHPEVPVNSEMISVPAGAGIHAEIISQKFKEYRLSDLGINFPLMPHQPPVAKSGDPAPFVYHSDAYGIDAFSPENVVNTEYLGIMRGTGIGRIDLFPVQYNPSTGMIRIYEELTVEVTFEGADPGSAEASRRLYTNHYFEPVFRSLCNYLEPAGSGREEICQYPVKYVIVSDRMFEESLQPLIDWKRRKGFTVIEAYTDDPNVGTTTMQIKIYLQSLYENATTTDPAPSFILFVGDIAQVPTFTGVAAGHVTDLYYCDYTGDYFPEVYYGRMSAQNVAQLQPQVEKTLMYEQYTMPEPTYLDTVVMIAGMDGTFGPVHGNGQINYGTINYFNASNGIYSHTYLYPQSGSNAAQIRQNISDGVTLANYTAHGSPSGWADPSFTVGDIPALQNEGKYGLLVGNCCSTSEYQVNECFGEAIVRAAGKGAVGYIGASNSTYWDEDYYFGVGAGPISGNPPSYEETSLGYYDRAFHTHGEPFADWYSTADQMVFAGNLAVTEGSPGSALYYWEAYCLMGDPSLMVYLSVPPAMTVTYDPLIPLGSPTFSVSAAPFAYVAVSVENVCYGAALADSNGLAVLDIAGLNFPGLADVVATAQNYQPFTGTVLVANPEGPYVMLNEYLAVDSLGNDNGMAENGEIIFLDAELKNWGSSDAVNTSATIVSGDEFITITDNYQEYGIIPAQDSILQEDAFEFVVADSIPDMHIVDFVMEIQEDTREAWSSDFSITLYAPVLELAGLSVVDTAGGNGNFRMDAGETVDLVLECRNTGHCDAFNLLAFLQSDSPYITIPEDSVLFDTLSWNGSHMVTFTAVLSDEIETGTTIDLEFVLASSPYWVSKTYLPQVGLVLEDFETGDFSAFGWVQGGSQPWLITAEDVYEGIYSAMSGDINDNQSSILMIDMEVAVDDSISFYRKVSCEDDPANNYDWLAFYIDDIEQGRWDGEMGWEQVSYPVAAGQHTFKWVYNKDYSVSTGLDAGWIDFIVFPTPAPIISVPDKPSKPATTFSVGPVPARDKAEAYISLTAPEIVSVAIQDLTGRTVMTAVSAGRMDPGAHRVSLDLEPLPSGIYFCTLCAGEEKITKKIIISK
jgi:hypothetical protein